MACVLLGPSPEHPGAHRDRLRGVTTPIPHLGGQLWLTDGGLETTLVFLDGIDLPDFAAFPLLDTPDGREHLAGLLLALPGHRRASLVPPWSSTRRPGGPTPTGAPDSGTTRTELEAVNRRAVQFVADLAADARRRGDRAERRRRPSW